MEPVEEGSSGKDKECTEDSSGSDDLSLDDDIRDKECTEDSSGLMTGWHELFKVPKQTRQRRSEAVYANYAQSITSEETDERYMEPGEEGSSGKSDSAQSIILEEEDERSPMDYEYLQSRHYEAGNEELQTSLTKKSEVKRENNEVPLERHYEAGEEELDKWIAEESEKRIDTALMKNIVSIDKEMERVSFDEVTKIVTPTALTSCNTNALFKAFEVNKELKDLAEKRGPEQEEFDKLANSVGEFASAMINPLKSDAELRKKFKRDFGVVLDKAIYWEQKKFISHPVVDALLQEMWYGSFFDLSNSPWRRYWKFILLNLWAPIDVFVFPFIFALLFTIHVLCPRKKRGIPLKGHGKAVKGDGNEQEIPLKGHAKAVKGDGNEQGAEGKDMFERYLEYFTTPCFIFVRDTLSYLTLLVLHFFICLSPSTVALSSLEWVVLVFFLGRILMEVQQFINPKKTYKKANTHKSEQGGNYAVCSSHEQNANEEVPLSSSSLPATKNEDVLQSNFRNYVSDQWNLLDVIILAIYTATFTLRVVSWSVSVSVANNRLLAVAYYSYGFIAMLLTLRAFGHVMEGVRGMGAVLIALFVIVRNVSAIFWQFIAVLVAFSIAITNIYVVERSYVSTRNATEELVCSTDHAGVDCWWSVTKHLAWSLLGLADLDSLNSVDGPSVTIVHFLYSLFLILGVILLVNMMIALLSNTYTRVEENSLKEWSFKKAVTIKTYKTYHPVPVPFNLMSVPALALYHKFKCCKCKPLAEGDEEEKQEEEKAGAQKKGEKHPPLKKLIKRLQARYFATYSDSFPLTDQRKMDQLLNETNGNRRMANQISRRLFREHGGLKQKMFKTGANAWISNGIQIEGCLLTCIGADFCDRCETDSPERHGARYKTPFTKEMPRMEVLIQESGEMRILGVGAVFGEYDCHWMPGWRHGTVGYCADHGTIYDREHRITGRACEDAMAHRGDLMACEVDFDHETRKSILVKFFLNGREIGEATARYSRGWKNLFPYIGMGKGIRVLAKMCPRDESPGEEEEEEAFSFDKAKQEIKELRRETKEMFQAVQGGMEELKSLLEEIKPNKLGWSSYEV